MIKDKHVQHIPVFRKKVKTESPWGILLSSKNDQRWHWVYSILCFVFNMMMVECVVMFVCHFVLLHWGSAIQFEPIQWFQRNCSQYAFLSEAAQCEDWNCFKPEKRKRRTRNHNSSFPKDTVEKSNRKNKKNCVTILEFLISFHLFVCFLQQVLNHQDQREHLYHLLPHVSVYWWQF